MSDARLSYREGFRHFVEQRLDDAITAYRRAIALDPKLAIAWNGLAMALHSKGDLGAAIEAASGSSSSSPTSRSATRASPSFFR